MDDVEREQREEEEHIEFLKGLCIRECLKLMVMGSIPKRMWTRICMYDEQCRYDGEIWIGLSQQVRIYFNGLYVEIVLKDRDQTHTKPYRSCEKPDWVVEDIKIVKVRNVWIGKEKRSQVIRSYGTAVNIKKHRFINRSKWRNMRLDFLPTYIEATRLKDGRIH